MKSLNLSPPGSGVFEQSQFAVSLGDEGRAWITAAVGRRMVCQVAKLLGEHEIPLMLLKGAWLHHQVYRDPADRPMTDVDLLVQPKQYVRAKEILTDSRFVFFSEADSAVTLRSLDSPIMLDLHRHLFVYGMFQMDTDALFDRASIDRDAFGAPVRVPDPYDGYAHLLGHFVKGRVRDRTGWRLRDFAEVARRFDLHPKRCSEHLQNCGLRRAAAFLLPILWEHAEDSFAREVLEHLSIGRWDQALAASSLRLVSQRRLRALEVVSPHLLDTTLMGGLASLGAHLKDALFRPTTPPVIVE